MRYLTVSALLVITIAILTACGQSSIEKMHNHMEKVVSLESDFEKQQDPIAELEKQEKEIYNKIIDLDKDSLDEIKELSQGALELIDQRTEKVKLEKDSMEASKKEFEKIEPLIEDLEKEDVKEKAKQLYETMMNRYNTYQKINTSYQDALKLDKELYHMLQEEKLKEKELREHINKINESYDKVITANNTFNDYTNQYNSQKQEFYKLAGLTQGNKTESSKNESENEKSE